ncbi:MAG: MFS transporter [Gemmatimonadetes bacterium]|nr:MFS transporter [Gemmatimonadota bacterium]MBT5059441.1 MFS transporter [Gemmatimonadota bacterium]MBT5146529.1 MFS transporter [Gemmatimonadota bacterium]MBT5591450.1 MFS transporter [Gemmatimonadota bacterium]MBT5962095.1 MFS transporter [Gemmatimonadota bacterium]
MTEASDVRDPNPILQLLRSRFKWLFYSNLTNAIGMELRIMAQAWLILELGGSQFWVGAATGLRVFPYILASLAAGVLIDRIGGRTILLWDRLGLMLLAAVTALIVFFDVATVSHVVALSVAAGGVLALGMPSSNSLVVELVPRERLQTANSLNTFTFSIARALGPMSGGLLIAAFGLVSPWLALVGLYAIAALCTRRLPKVEVKSTGSAWESLVGGYRHVRSHPVISRVMVLCFSIIMATTVMPVWPIYARDRFDVGGTGFGTMMAVFAVGQGISAMYVANRKQWPRLSVPILYGATVWSAMMILFGFSTSYPLTLAALFMMGTAIPPWVTSLATILQTQTERAMIGRVMALYSMAIQIGFMGWLLGGWLGELIGNDWMLLLTGSANALLTYLIFLSHRDMRQL